MKKAKMDLCSFEETRIKRRPFPDDEKSDDRPLWKKCKELGIVMPTWENPITP